jgi:hypothetical protein
MLADASPATQHMLAPLDAGIIDASPQEGDSPLAAPAGNTREQASE